MPAYTTENHDTGGRRQLVATVVFLVVALALNYLPGEAQQGVASLLRSTVLRPFVMTQEGLAGARVRATESGELRARLDSMVAVVTARTDLEEENRRLRGLLSLGRRIGAGYRAASVVRPGTAGSESTFSLDVGSRDGIRAPAPVITRHGLVGLVRDVQETTSIGMDWSHPAFRASGSTLDGTVTGIVESHRGDFREQDRLMLNGTPFHVTLEEGTVIITSGLGGVFPRGIPVGRVRGLAESDAGWRKSYWLDPFTRPGNVTHVLVAAAAGEAELPADLRGVWPEDSILTVEELVRRDGLRRDSLEAVHDSLEMLRAILAAGRSQDSLRTAVLGDTAGGVSRPAPPTRPAAGEGAAAPRPAPLRPDTPVVGRGADTTSARARDTTPDTLRVTTIPDTTGDTRPPDSIRAPVPPDTTRAAVPPERAAHRRAGAAATPEEEAPAVSAVAPPPARRPPARRGEGRG